MLQKWTWRKKKHFLNTYKMWCFLVETGLDKLSYRHYTKKISMMIHGCAFCNYFKLDYFDGEFYYRNCPLMSNKRCYNQATYECCDGIYQKWDISCLGSETRKVYARQIKEKIEKWLKSEGVLK